MELFNRLDPAVHEGLNEALGHRADVLAHGVGEGVVLVGTRSALARLIGDAVLLDFAEVPAPMFTPGPMLASPR